MDTAKIIKSIEALISTAGDTFDSQEALRFTQAALNAANTMRTLAGPDWQVKGMD